MTSLETEELIPLATGNTCQLLRIRNDFIPNGCATPSRDERLSGRWKKAWLYQMLAATNLAQAGGLRKDDVPRIRS